MRVECDYCGGEGNFSSCCGCYADEDDRRCNCCGKFCVIEECFACDGYGLVEEEE